MISMGSAKKWYKGTNLPWFLKFCSFMAFSPSCESECQKKRWAPTARAELLCQVILEDRSVVHHKLYVLEFADVLQGIPGNRNHLGIGPGSNRPDGPSHVQHFRRP